MRTKWFRLSSKAKTSFIIAFLLVILVAVIPNYDSYLYSKAESVNDKEKYVGYPAGDEVPVLEKWEEIVKTKTVFTIEVDASSIKPSGVYLGLSRSTVTKSKFLRFFMGFGNDYETSMGQYYLAELDNGDKVLFFLDDHVVKLPKSGRVKLPRCEVKISGVTAQIYLAEKTGLPKEDLFYYVDAAGTWRTSQLAKKGMNYRLCATGIIILIVVPLVYFLLLFLEKKLYSNVSDDTETEARVSTVHEMSQQAKAISNKRTEEKVIVSRRAEEDKSACQKAVEERLDKFSESVLGGADWRQDSRRSFSKFGAALIAVGITIISMLLLDAFLKKEFPIVYAIFIAIGIILWIVGARIASWDKPKKNRKSRKEPKD